MNFINAITQFARDEKGVTAIEYGLIAAAIAAVVGVAATALAGNIKTIFAGIGNALTAAAS